MPLVPGRCYQCLSIGNFKLRESCKWWTNNSDHNQKNKTRMVMLQLNFKKTTKFDEMCNKMIHDCDVYKLWVNDGLTSQPSVTLYTNKANWKRNATFQRSVRHGFSMQSLVYQKENWVAVRKFSCYSYCTGWFIGFLIIIQFPCSLHPQKQNNHQPQDGPQ